ncbi:hypothetical protein BH23BAC1_BH23BAC1_11070 [soil metagenome]
MKKKLHFFAIIIILTFLSACRQDSTKEETVKETSVPIEEVEDTAVDYSKWIGTWEREGTIDPASMSITNLKDSEFEFHLNAYDGINASEISGAATIEDNIALYMAAGAEDTCRLSFLMQDSLLVINQLDDFCSGATEIDFSGEYFHERFFKDKAMEEDAAARNRRKSEN